MGCYLRVTTRVNLRATTNQQNRQITMILTTTAMCLAHIANASAQGKMPPTLEVLHPHQQVKTFNASGFRGVERVPLFDKNVTGLYGKIEVDPIFEIKLKTLLSSIADGIQPIFNNKEYPMYRHGSRNSYIIYSQAFKSYALLYRSEDYASPYSKLFHMNGWDIYKLNCGVSFEVDTKHLPLASRIEYQRVDYNRP